MEEKMDANVQARWSREAREKEARLADLVARMIRSWITLRGLDYREEPCFWSTKVDNGVIGPLERVDNFKKYIRENVKTLSDDEIFRCGSKTLRFIFRGSTGQSFDRVRYLGISGTCLTVDEMQELGRVVWPEEFVDNRPSPCPIYETNRADALE